MKAFRSGSKRYRRCGSIVGVSNVAAAALLALAPAAFGATDNWTNAAGGSWTDTTWSLGSAPGGSNDAVFNLGSTLGYTVTIPANESVQNIFVDTDTTSFNLNGKTLAPIFNINTLNGGNVNVGAAAGQNASLTVYSTVAGAQFQIGAGLFVGASGGTGSVTLDNVAANQGTVYNTGVSVGVGANSVGTLIVKDGAQLGTSFGQGPILVGDMGAGGNGSVSYNHSSGGSKEAQVKIGGNGSLTLANQSSFSYQGLAQPFLIFGTSAGGGSMTVDNSTFQCITNLAVAKGGTLILTDGAQLPLETQTTIGMAATSSVGSAKVTASGTGTYLSTDLLDVGDNGTTGTATFSGGAELILGSFNAYIGGNGGTGSLQLSGTGTAFSPQGAATNVQIVIGANSSGQAGTGTVQLDTGATGTVPGTITVDAGGTLNVLSGATLFATNLDLSHGGTTNFTGGTITLTGGTLTASTFSLPNTSTLAGTGTLTGNLTSSGSVSPGDAPGILKVLGNYIQNASGTLDIGLQGTTPGTQYDQLLITGSASFAGTLDVTSLPGFTPVLGNSFDLFTDSSEIGTFSTIELPPLGSGSWDTSKLYTNGVISVVPEPTSLGLLAGGGVMMLRRRSIRGRT